RKETLIRHKNKIHVNKQFICNINKCGKDCNSKQSLINHKNNHLIDSKNNNYFYCFWPKCQYKATNKQRFICDFNECHKSFNTKSNLIQHKSCVHLNEKKFKCNKKNCGKKFSSKSNLIVHKRIHSGEKPFVCHFNDCNKSFIRKAHLKGHLTKFYNLIVHKRIHSGETLFYCHFNDCTKSFTQKSHLKDHIKRHMNIKSYKCIHNNCGKMFATNRDLKSHGSRVHKLNKLKYN
ncbi:unnamed protein product, partial [Medioppia subpectinata]